MGIVKSAMSLFGIKSDSDEEFKGIELKEFLEKLPELTGYDVKFRECESEDGTLKFEVEGEEADSFLGGNSNMLDALTHISMRIIRKQLGIANKALESEDEKERIRVIFDADGFRETKENELKELADRIHKKVIQLGGKPVYVPALSPSERRIVHTHLADLGEVGSESVGKGIFKRIRVKLNADSKHRRRGGPRREGGGDENRRGGGRRFDNRGGRGRGGRRGPRNENSNDPNRPDNFGNREDGPANFNRGNEVNGNVVAAAETVREIDDNIGNRIDPNDRDDQFNS